jgi:hypothetical protein
MKAAVPVVAIGFAGALQVLPVVSPPGVSDPLASLPEVPFSSHPEATAANPNPNAIDIMRFMASP